LRIIVPVKQVPETANVRMDEQTGTMIREGVEAIVNPLDLYAIESAVALRESIGEGRCEVVAISMGPPAAERALREAISMGADSGVLLTDKAFAGSDTWATSCALAGAICRLAPFDLVICGERATDGDTGQVGPGIAAWLNLPVVTYVCRVESLADGACRVRRLVEDGYETLEVELPGVLTVVKEIADPRLPTLAGKRRARRAEIASWGAEDIDVTREYIGLGGSPTRVVKIFRPTVARHGRIVTAGDDDAVDRAAGELVEFLMARALA
jgi:electron transfer flavoprotein beta subunit